MKLVGINFQSNRNGCMKEVLIEKNYRNNREICNLKSSGLDILREYGRSTNRAPLSKQRDRSADVSCQDSDKKAE